MGPAKGYRLVLGVLALTLLLAAPAGASERILARWNVTISGTIHHTWSLPDPTACDATGNGSVSVRFASTRSERITIADNGYGPGDISWGDVFGHIGGTITAVDARTRNPPRPGDTCDTSEPVPDTSSCGTYHFHSGLSVNLPLGTARHGFSLTDFGNFTNAARSGSRTVEDCEMDRFVSFAWIGPGRKAGVEDLKLPGYPTWAQLASRHGRIVIAASQSHRWLPSALTVRHVRIVFTRVG